MKEKQNKTFIFLYPQQEIFDFELEFGSGIVDDKWWAARKTYFEPKLAKVKNQQEKQAIQAEARKDRTQFFRPTYKRLLNQCISQRYRKNDFQIVYALLDNEPLADIMVRRPEDKVIFVGMDAKTHRTKRQDGTFPYPDQDYILNQISPTSRLVVGGFHMWDCVEKLAKTAYDKGISVLVDEDLTEFFPTRTTQKGFKTRVYPSYNPRALEGDMFEMFMGARKNKPWLWQKY